MWLQLLATWVTMSCKDGWMKRRLFQQIQEHGQAAELHSPDGIRLVRQEQIRVAVDHCKHGCLLCISKA